MVVSILIFISAPYDAMTTVDQALVDHYTHLTWQVIPSCGHFSQCLTLSNVTLIKLRFTLADAQIGYWGATGAPR
jgi:hypothetical protein